MLGSKITNHWSFNIWNVFWLILSPLTLLTVVILTWLNTEEFETNGYVYPKWVTWAGNLLTSTTLWGLLGWSIYAVIDTLWNKRVT